MILEYKKINTSECPNISRILRDSDTHQTNRDLDWLIHIVRQSRASPHDFCGIIYQKLSAPCRKLILVMRNLFVIFPAIANFVLRNICSINRYFDFETALYKNYCNIYSGSMLKKNRKYFQFN